MDPLETTMAPLFDELSDGICATDDKGAILYMNPAAERLLGITVAETRGKTLCDLLCGRLTTKELDDCAKGCPLRDPKDPTKAVSFEGSHYQGKGYQWTEYGIQSVDKRRSLRVRCLRMPDSCGRHFTLIEKAPEP